MEKIGFIPLRAGSKGIPNKNKKRIAGRPLYQWVMTEAVFSTLDEVIVFTDDMDIINHINKEYYWTKKLKAIQRSIKNANDNASTESAMIEYCESIDWEFKFIVLLQATSPLTSTEDIDKSVFNFESNKYDSQLSCVRTKRFIWDDDGNSINYDYRSRPRRQDFDGFLIENGAIYITKRDILKKNNNRLGGKIGLFNMNEDTLIEIDNPIDFKVVEQLIFKKLKEQKRGASKISLLVLDVDGVFTDGKVIFNSKGEFSKEFSMRDGMGLQLLRESGVDVIVLTSENSPTVKSRMTKLNLESYYGVKDKYSLLSNILREKNMSRNETVYMGDDINDLSNIASAGWGICPIDAMDEVKQIADLVLNKCGGTEAIRELTNFIIRLNNKQ